MPNWVEHEKSFITSGPDQTKWMLRLIWFFAELMCPKVSFVMFQLIVLYNS